MVNASLVMWERFNISGISTSLIDSFPAILGRSFITYLKVFTCREKLKSTFIDHAAHLLDYLKLSQYT